MGVRAMAMEVKVRKEAMICRARPYLTQLDFGLLEL